MAITQDQLTLGTNYSAASSSTIALTTTGAVASGGFIVLGVYWFTYNNVTLNSVSGGSLTWTVDKQFQSGGSVNAALVSAQAPSGLASSTSITATFSSSIPTFKGICGASWTGVATPTVIDGTPGTSSGSAAAWTAGSISTSNANDLVVGACTGDASGSFSSTPTGGWTENNDFSDSTDGDSGTQVYQIVSSTGAYNPGGTWSTSVSFSGVSVAYQAAATAAAAAVPFLHRMPLGV